MPMYDELIQSLRTEFGDIPNEDICDCEMCMMREYAKDGDYTECVSRLGKAALDAIEELYLSGNNLVAVVDDMAEDLKKFHWIPVTERMPDSEAHVLATCRTLIFGYAYVCVAYYAAPKAVEVTCTDEIEVEYDEEEDKYFLLSGWYEVINNWGDYSSVSIEDKVTHWMPLPEPPKDGE